MAKDKKDKDKGNERQRRNLHLFDYALVKQYLEFKSENPRGTEEEFAKLADIPLSTWYDKKKGEKFNELVEAVKKEIALELVFQAKRVSLINKDVRIGQYERIYSHLDLERMGAGGKDVASIAKEQREVMKQVAIETGDWEEKRGEGNMTIVLGSLVPAHLQGGSENGVRPA